MRYVLQNYPCFVNDFGRLPKGTVVYLNDDGQYHRDDEPAVVQPNGEEEWYRNGKLHRIVGPARNVPAEHDEYWFQDGKLHREDGPAHTWGTNGQKTYHYRGIRVIDDTGNVCIPQVLDAKGPSYKELQEFVIRVRPDLISQFKDLDMDLAKKFQHELELAKVDL